MLLCSEYTLHVVVCHLPSRSGSSREGKKNRALALKTLANMTDSLLSQNPMCKLMEMGDFKSTLKDLRTLKSLVPLTPNLKRPTSGTYRFKGNWSWLDHIFVSPALCEKTSKAVLYTQPWMQRCMADGSWYPRRTYMGTTYSGGVSDHVPIYVDLGPLSNSPEGGEKK